MGDDAKVLSDQETTAASACFTAAIFGNFMFFSLGGSPTSIVYD